MIVYSVKCNKCGMTISDDIAKNLGVLVALHVQTCQFSTSLGGGGTSGAVTLSLDLTSYTLYPRRESI